MWSQQRAYYLCEHELFTSHCQCQYHNFYYPNFIFFILNLSTLNRFITDSLFIQGVVFWWCFIGYYVGFVHCCSNITMQFIMFCYANYGSRNTCCNAVEHILTPCQGILHISNLDITLFTSNNCKHILQ